MKVTVMGAGSWGTTLAILLGENDHRVVLWEFYPEFAKAIRRDHENKRFLPGIPVPASIRIESDAEAALEGAELVLFVVPSHAMRNTARIVTGSAAFTPDTIVVNASKGLEEGSSKRMSEVLLDELPVGPDQVCTLAGPSHAEEVSRRMPTSVVAASTSDTTARAVQESFFRPYFRVYTNSDIVGVEIGVALKNIIAIAAGVCDGLGYGDNTKAALITRGLVDITRLGSALGAREETFFGLAGVGDLIVTCLSRHSRNRHVGERIGKGESLEAIQKQMVMVAEGVRTTRAAEEMGRKMGIELPIVNSVYEVLYGGKNPEEAIGELMTRPQKEEMSWTNRWSQEGGSS